MKGLCVLVFCASLYTGGDCGVASFITPCHSTDSACLKSSAQKAVPILAAGIPEFGMVPLDPLHVARVKASQAGLNMDFRNTTVKGLRHSTVEGLRRHNNKLYLDIKCSVTLVGNYTLGGKLLIFQIDGDGKYKIVIQDIVVKIVLDVEELVKDGEKYWSISDWKHTADVKTNAKFHFQNLFNGRNEELSRTIHTFANSNWHDIFQEVAPPIVKAITKAIVDETQKFFLHVPMNQLALD